ncbi:MAG: ABC transporter ATP-binding protein [Eubacteriales bacterium]|nr:ABC transporter ATP-binding protein [Eubacteriales bacterium]
MLNALKKIWQFAGNERTNINKSIAAGFVFAIFHMFQVGAIYLVVTALAEQRASLDTAWQTLACLTISILGRTAANYFSQLQQTHAGYFMVADKRISIGNRLKTVPMGYFNDNRLGEITGVATSVLEEVETTAPMVLVGILGGFINAMVFLCMIFFFDVRVGILAAAGTVIYLFVSSAMEKKSASYAAKRQESAARMVGAILEYVQGMSVVKSFNLSGRGDKRLAEALEENRRSNLNIERLFTPYVMAQGLTLQVSGVVLMGAAVLFWMNGSMPLADALMTVIISFMVFAQIETAGSGMAILRIVSSGINRANEMDTLPQMDEKGRAVEPGDHEIVFDHVNFSYGEKQILHDISLRIPDRTTTAVVGPSGSGKTTICSLIARFWDVGSGSVSIGGTDVRDYTLESLMDQVAMVFQRVYLFADTIENNIKFGCPGATRQQVMEAAKKACCDDFIEALPDGYDTVIGEGGASLSGGEKQRISIARAILKDAPIIIFDEATANVDPENEDRLQKAVEALTRNKTIIMIAHRLKTVRNADQLLVLDQGRIVQQGRHQDLIREEGIYADFVVGRERAVSWRM